MGTLDDLHLAMGRFLTESSLVENVMLAVSSRCQQGRTVDDAFSYFMDMTFGDKIEAFKKMCNAHPFYDKHRAILNEVYDELDVLLPKRNFIVHGTTLEHENEAYRIGKRKRQPDWLRNVIANDLIGPHVFTAQDISKATEEFLHAKNTLLIVGEEIIR